MKTLEVKKPATQTAPVKPNRVRSSRSHKKETALSFSKLVYGLYGLVTLSLVVNIFAAITFIGYTRGLSSPLSVDLSSSSLPASVGWLPPGAEEVRTAELPATEGKRDLDNEVPPPPASTSGSLAPTPKVKETSAPQAPVRQ